MRLAKLARQNIPNFPAALLVHYASIFADPISVSGGTLDTGADCEFMCESCDCGGFERRRASSGRTCRALDVCEELLRGSGSGSGIEDGTELPPRTEAPFFRRFFDGGGM